MSLKRNIAVSTAGSTPITTEGSTPITTEGKNSEDMAWFDDMMIVVEDEYLTPLPAPLPRRPYPRETIIDPPAKIILPYKVHMLTPVFGIPKITKEMIAASERDKTQVVSKRVVRALRQDMMEIPDLEEIQEEPS